MPYHCIDSLWEIDNFHMALPRSDPMPSSPLKARLGDGAGQLLASEHSPCVFGNDDPAESSGRFV